MSYAKSLKKSPFKTISISLGKLPDGGIYQNVFITQDGEPSSASFDCPSYAPSEERKGFLPLVKEALKRAQSMEELTDLLKPPAVELTAPVEPIPIEVPWFKTGEDYERWSAAADEAMAEQQKSIKVELLYLLMKQEDHVASIEAVLNSGLLPEPQLQQWLDDLTERAIRRMLGRSGCPTWETWATKYLSGEDRTEEAARAAREAAWATWAARAARGTEAARAARGTEAARAARAAAWAAWAAEAARAAAEGAAVEEAAWAARAARAAEAAAEGAAWAARAARAAEAAEARAAERKAQYDDLFNLINGL